MDRQKKLIVSTYLSFNYFCHLLLLIFCLILFYLAVGCSWEAKKTCKRGDSSCPSPSSTTSSSSSSSTTSSSSSTTTSSTTTSSTTTSTQAGSTSLVSLAIGNTGCSNSQTLPDYKEVEGQCLPSCEKRLETNLKKSGTILGRGEICSHSEYYIVDESISENQIYDTDLGACCSLRLNNSVNTDINHSCRIVESEKYVQCWGSNEYGQLGNNCKPSHQQAQNANYVVKENNTSECSTNEVPQNDRLSGVVSLALGKKHSCGLLEDKRKVVCWGDNQEGQLGVSTDTSESLKPIAVEIPESMQNLNIESIIAGDNYGCLKVEANTQKNHYCWGSGYPEDL